MRCSEESERLLVHPSPLKKYGSEPFPKAVQFPESARRDRSMSWNNATDSLRLWNVGRKPDEITNISNYPIQEVYVAKKEISETILGRRTFHIGWALYIIISTLLGGISLYVLNEIDFIDSWFLCTSSFANAGLSTVPMTDITSTGFTIVWIMMYIGSTSVMTVITMLWRRNRLGRALKRMDLCLEHYGVTPVDVTSAAWAVPNDRTEPVEYIKYHRQLYDSLLVAVGLIVVYMTTICVLGMGCLCVCLSTYPMDPELERRGYSHLHNSFFLSLSAYTNTGATLSSSSMMWYRDKPAVLVIVAVLMLLGNVLFPFMLYLCTEAVISINQKLTYQRQSRVQSSLLFIKRNPRVVCSYFFCYDDVVYLVHASLFCIVLEWCVFILICVIKERHSLQLYGDGVSLALMGLFQTLNSRHAGKGSFPPTCVCADYVGDQQHFQLVDEGKRHSVADMIVLMAVSIIVLMVVSCVQGFTIFNVGDLPDALLLVTSMMMFTSPVPYMNILHTTTVHAEDPDSPEVSHPALRKVLERVFFRVWFLRCSLLFFLALTEDTYLETHRDSVSLWMVTFELVSAFGLVGLSFGAPNSSTSLSGAFTVPGKFLMILTCFFGKNRGLPNPRDQVIDFRFAKLKNILYDLEMDIRHQKRSKEMTSGIEDK